MVNYKDDSPQDQNKAWSPMKALGNVRRKLASDLQVSSFDVDISNLPKLPLGDYASTSKLIHPIVGITERGY